ncbi:hypothetical protein [Bartonella sp. ML70XJBT]|uniref:hypothetical protein n=1 Tax=Bartonella sp. ML70XJBT TaxID=3019096 RepID=UPI0023622C2C|nr:hypothetical protein [Bartonella sp. ML70XJBT]
MFSYINARGITNALRGVWYGRYGSARYPAHDDQLPSLSLANGHDGRLLLTCYAGCSFREIIQALRRIGLLGKQALVIRKVSKRFVRIRRNISSLTGLFIWLHLLVKSYVNFGLITQNVS